MKSWSISPLSVMVPPILKRCRGRVLYFGSQFQGFSLRLLGSVAFGSLARQSILGECTTEDISFLMVIRKQRKAWQRSGYHL